MVRPLSIFLPVALAATAVNAQLGEFIKNAFGGVISQKPLASGIPSALIEKNTHQITSENWRSAINVTVDPAASEGDAKEWLFYFTTKASNATSTRNVTYWDGVYNVCLLFLACMYADIAYSRTGHRLRTVHNTARLQAQLRQG
jgi:hypothetical protein